jgi:hypothetical protein
MDKCPSCKAWGYDLWQECPCCGTTFCKDCGILYEQAEELAAEQEEQDEQEE